MVKALRPDIHKSVQKWVLPNTLSHRRRPLKYPEFSSNLNRRWHTRPEARRTARSKPAATLALKQQAVTLARPNLIKRNWFHSLPFQQFQALLTLFPKSFSSFPHGTCVLSVFSLYLALEEDYLPFSAPRPKYATQKKPSDNAIRPPTRDSHPLWRLLPKGLRQWITMERLRKTTIHKQSLWFTIWAFPGSVALTNGIMFIFFSSAYLYA